MKRHMSRVRLKQVTPTRASFEVVETDPAAPPRYLVITADEQSDDRIHWEWCAGRKRLADTPLREVVIAGARECAEGRGLVNVQLIVSGVPVAFGSFAVMQQFGGGWVVKPLFDSRQAFEDAIKSLTLPVTA